MNCLKPNEVTGTLWMQIKKQNWNRMDGRLAIPQNSFNLRQRNQLWLKLGLH